MKDKLDAMLSMLLLELTMQIGGTSIVDAQDT